MGVEPARPGVLDLVISALAVELSPQPSGLTWQPSGLTWQPIYVDIYVGSSGHLESVHQEAFEKLYTYVYVIKSASA